uniref:ENT domain-containing protein n=1 Tax=Aegilops tauschii TaxID=37682 RepID=M8C5H6_AEGTA
MAHEGPLTPQGGSGNPRLADCIQLKEFHISSLRVPQPHDAPTAPPYGKQFPAADNKESLLTNLRLSLNISNEEHLLQLRRLLSS